MALGGILLTKRGLATVLKDGLSDFCQALPVDASRGPSFGGSTPENPRAAALKPPPGLVAALVSAGDGERTSHRRTTPLIRDK